MSRARITEVASAVAGFLGRHCDPESDVTVERVYSTSWLDPDLYLDNPTLADRFTGRRVYVAGLAQRQQGPATRAEDANDYDVAVIVIERYTGEEAEVPDEWLDDRTAWVEAEVYDRLGDAREEDDEPVPGAFPVSQEIQQANPDLLREQRLFWSEAVITFRKVEDTRP